MTDTHSLLADFARTSSESAFRELVERYLGLVYSTALRLVGGDVHLAEDVTQTVFLDLARKARRLSPRVMLGGWLHRRTLNVAAPMMRSERRRRSREREVVQMNAVADDSANSLAQFEPILDEVITRLGTEDRVAIILRFFERRDFRSIGEALGSNEDAARMRLSRALDKMRVLLRKRGVTISAAALGTSLAADAIVAAPAGLQASVAGFALANASSGGVLFAALIKITTMSKLQTAILATVVISGLTTSLLFQHQARNKLSEENESLRRQIIQLRSENELVSNRVARLTEPASVASDRLRELLRLRGEVGLLLRNQRVMQEALAAAGSKLPGQPAVGVSSQAEKPAPFQMQIVLDEPGEDSETMTNNASGGRVETVYLQKTPLLDYTAVKSAALNTNTPTGTPQIDIEFNEVGKDLFAQVTKENINKRLAIVLDGRLHSLPVIRSEISGGKAQVTGSFTEEEARDLAAKINDAIASK